MATEVRVPDIGDFADGPGIEIFVDVGDVVEINTPLLLPESDRVALDVPLPIVGRISDIRVAVGQIVSKGSV